MAATRLLILAGGQSDEHEVSLVSARSVLGALAGRADLLPEARVVSRIGTCLSAADSLQALARGARVEGGGAPLSSLALRDACDVVLPLIHGPFGEDGTLQGLLELAGLPYVGSGVLASALCMDKAMSKAVLAQAGIPQVDYRLVTAAQLHADPAAVAAAIVEMPAPWFVKPANLGSSVGISRVEQAGALTDALAEALRFGRRAIVEAGVNRPRELEVAVLGNDDPKVSSVGEITYQASFYDYATKYTEGRAQLHVPAAIDPELAGRLRALARKAYMALDCAGMARVDFLLNPATGALLLNEVNTIPGFTPLSMYPQLWRHDGLAYGDLIARLCALALARHAAARPSATTATGRT